MNLLATAFILVALPAVALAQTHPSPSYDDMTARRDLPLLGRSQRAITVPNVAALKASTPVSAVKPATIGTQGYSVPGDGGGAIYTWSLSACLLNRGAGDNGSQVKPIVGTGCWIMQPTGTRTDIRIWGAKADNATDIGRFIQAAYAANVGCIYIPSGIWKWSTTVTMTVQPPCFKGAGWNEAVQAASLSTTNMTGTWIHFSSAAFSPVIITDIAGQGGTGGFSNMAFYDDQPTPAPGWSPMAYPYIFTLNANKGRIDFDNLMFYNTTHCMNFIQSARAHVTNIYGQPVGTCLQIDKQTDISLLDGVEFWPFWTANANIANYLMANVDPILYLRADSPTIRDVFSFGYHSGIAFGQSANGATSGAQITDFQGDADQYSFWIKRGVVGVTLQIGNLRTAGENWITGGTLVNSEGYRDEGTNSAVDIANLDCYYAGANCVDLTGAGRVSIGNAKLWNFNNSNTSSVGLQAGTAGIISLANPPSVVNPANGGTVIPATSSLGGTYAVRGVRQYWTPIVSGTTTTGAVAYRSNVGTFWYDGSLATFNFHIALNGPLSEFAGNLAIKGLPLTFNGTENQNGYCYIASHSGVALDTGYTVLSGIIAGGSEVNQILLLESGGDASTVPVPVGDFHANAMIEGSCSMAAGL